MSMSTKTLLETFDENEKYAEELGCVKIIEKMKEYSKEENLKIVDWDYDNEHVRALVVNEYHIPSLLTSCYVDNFKTIDEVPLATRWDLAVTVGV